MERASQPRAWGPIRISGAAGERFPHRRFTEGWLEGETLFTWYEFFAGGGMARLGLGAQWRAIFANDIDAKKAASYRRNFAGDELRMADIRRLTADDLPGRVTLAWASFPCQDLSLAGAGRGLDGERSGAFWAFWRLMIGLGRQGRRPPLIVLENVRGAISSHEGQDFAAILGAMAAEGYYFGPLVMDAALFVPQSRPRLFIVGVHEEVAAPETLQQARADPLWHPLALEKARRALAPSLARRWLWWNMPAPPPRTMRLADLIENEPDGADWRTPEATRRLLSLMSSVHAQKVLAAQGTGERVIGGLYRRTRPDGNGARTQRAEVRFDGMAGCLRTPAGGSSRQTILLVQGDRVRSRLLSPREAARLMGLPDAYELPANAIEAYHLLGDGVVVPVVAWLEEYLLRPLAASAG